MCSSDLFGFQWKQNVPKGKGAWVVNANYVVSGQATGSAGAKNGSSGSDSSYGIFDSNSGINAMAQVGYKGNNWGAAIGYRYGSAGATVRDGAGAANGTLCNEYAAACSGTAYTNSLAFNAYWQPTQTGWILSISAGYGFNVVSGSVTPAKTNS